ncbi:MAG: hypothetical protein ACFFDH_01805 [Promethearchaeota archaeon]
MLHLKNKKSKRIALLFLIAIAMSFLNFNQYFWNNNNSKNEIDSDIDNRSQIFSELKTSDYAVNYYGMGGNMNITLHQSYFNDAFNKIVNTSIVDGNNFTIACPEDANFNSTFTNITVNDIIAPNRSLIIEETLSWQELLDSRRWTSFEVPGNCVLQNVSIYVRNNTGEDDYEIRLYESEEFFNDPDYYIKPKATSLAILAGAATLPTSTSTFTWLNLTYLNEGLTVSNTYNNTYFIAVRGSNDIGEWAFGNDGGGDGDNSVAWDSLSDTSPVAKDYLLKISLSPINNTPKPSEVNLKINNKTVDDIDRGSGFWESTLVNGSDSGTLNYNVSADWWDVECKISQVQINYTKTDLYASSAYYIAGSDETVNWTVAAGMIDQFDSNFEHYWINFTVPAKWSNFRAFNNTIELTDNTTLGIPQGDYKQYQIYNVSNGPNWYITANSTNLLYDIRAYTDTDTPIKFNFTNIVHFDANFSKGVDNGLINLTIYSPSSINNFLNYSLTNSSFNTGKDVYFGDWNISKNVTRYGDFRIKLGWNNGTDAGFLTDTIIIIADTSLEILQPQQDITFDSDRIFNISVSYNDTGQNKIISDGDIYYKINNGDYSTVNESVTYDIENGVYNITFDCNNSNFNYGPNNIIIKANGTYYNEQIVDFNFTILGLTDLIDSVPDYFPPSPSFFDSMDTFNFSFYFNDTIKETGISGATYTILINGSTIHNPLDDYDYGDGNYSITINCSDYDFASEGYGDFNISVYVENDYYYNHTAWFIINIMGNTSLSTSKFPDSSIGYYNSDQIFNITAYFEDDGRNEGITGGQVGVYVREVGTSTYTAYTPVIIYPFSVGYYNITVNCSDSIFNPYNKYNIKINITKTNYYTAEDILEEIVVGNTTLTIIDPIMPISFLENEIFNITLEYEDHTLSTGIIGADITYTLNGTGYRNDKRKDNLDGTYTITVNVSDDDFGFNYDDYKNRIITIRANKSYYINLTKSFTFERQILTKIEPYNNPPQIELIRGINATYIFNYTDRLNTPIDQYDTFENTTLLYGFQWYLWNNGSGYYTIEVNTTYVNVTGLPYTLNFSIYAFGNQSQDISLSILVTIIETNIVVQSWNENADFARSTDIPLIIDFYFNDTTNNQPIENLTNSNIRVRNYDTGIDWSPGFELFNRTSPGNYTLNIETMGASSGTYNLELQISKFPNYAESTTLFQFYLRGNYTYLNFQSISDPGGVLSSITSGHHYRIFEGSEINIVFNILDLEYNNNTVIQAATSYTIGYENLGTGANGTLQSEIQFVLPNHVGSINTSISELIAGDYSINISIALMNYEVTSFNFNLTILEKYNVSIDVISIPEEVIAGEVFNITILAQYYDGTEWLPLTGETIVVTPYFDGTAGSPITIPLYTNSSGIYIFQITTRTDAVNVSLIIEIPITYSHLGDTFTTSNIKLNPAPSGLNLEDLLPYLIIIGAAVAAGGGSFTVYRGVIVPKKREKTRILTEVKTIFDDAISLEHVLVLYKGTGVCIFFKSFGSEQIDPELISGFISAISSFGKDLVCQEELNEISYGDKMLLLSDGEYIRVALVLSKKASLILRRNLMEFIHNFEKVYAENLPKWRGQLNIFRGAGSIIDDIFSTSIILPHEITYEHSSIKTLKKSQSREVIKIAENLMKDSERNFFFIATLLKESTEKTGKDTAEVFMGIKELRDNKILMPIEISTIEKKPISQQEVNLINQKVGTLVNLSVEERDKLVNDLAQLGPAEREAYFVSIKEQHEIVSAPIESESEITVIENRKQANKEIKMLKKKALNAKKEKDYDKCLRIYQNAAKIALEWEILKESYELDETMRLTKIEDLKIKMKNLEKEAKLAAKEEKFNEATQKYKVSSKIASEIFKLGVDEMTKEVKRLTNKSKEYEKLV